ncbi:tumor necrosis factor receptor superfamily member 18 [Talpa occidentalis]|uniref:tumor necrosis factor receptor superfamily member 18 n=1 Tax=Talpa occidentalis TaxID=50954 RepID=UPI00188EED1D|nr:tumor necrosis factor receptor superfamily member 18 [Talpa occidentalis]
MCRPEGARQRRGGSSHWPGQRHRWGLSTPGARSLLKPGAGAGGRGAMGARAALCALALLCALGRAQRCGPGRCLLGSGTDERCCRSPGPAQDCASEDTENCSCLQPEFYCADPQCSSCRHHPCLPGQRAQAHGRFIFNFDCVDCGPGTFSLGQEDHCRPWTDCSQFGFSTVFPGNRTHNAMCSPGPPPAAPAMAADPLALAILAMAACALALTAAQLSLLLWWLRRLRLPGHWCPAPVGEASPGLLTDGSHPSGPLLPTEDACSCQFPEEERGEPLAEDKGQPADLWV